MLKDSFNIAKWYLYHKKANVFYSLNTGSDYCFALNTIVKFNFINICQKL